MDFLDPKKRRAYHIRLIVGYVLVAIVILLGTVIIVYGANGYGINTKTGQIVQNGLLFADSKPGGAEIYLNGNDQHASTSARLVLPSGNYKLDLKKTGYHDWSRSFTLNEQSIARYVYPFLFPVKPRIANLKNYANQPGLITQSPDRKWLLVENNAESTKTLVFDQYDTTTLDDPSPVVTPISLPADLLTGYGAGSNFIETEWSTDNIHLLLQHNYSGGSEFIILDRAHPDQSLNVNKLFGVSPSLVNLRDKKIDQLYIFNAADGSLQLGNTGDRGLAPAFLKNVLAYKSYGKDLVTYITANGEPAGKVVAKVWNNGKVYKLNEFSAGTHYLIDFAQFQGHFYYADGSDTSDRINIYKDPLDGLRDPATAKALPVIALHDPGATKLKFSENTRFIGVENSQNFAVYDLETQTSYQYPLTDALSGDMHWMDGHRFIGQSGGSVFVMDYDGINKRAITPTLLNDGGFFSREYNHLLTVASGSDGSFVLQDVDMRAGTDLPKNKQ
ncbi:PEGA domain-containing protein [Candidatus Saccharibacteria bacterium]|nr:PEGA domain-containing protein [Candidatus Saccharibacteria bacterium]